MCDRLPVLNTFVSLSRKLLRNLLIVKQRLFAPSPGPSVWPLTYFLIGQRMINEKRRGGMHVIGHLIYWENIGWEFNMDMESC